MKKNSIPVPVSVPDIQKYIRENHKKFLKDVGDFSQKVSDDYQLILTRLSARVSRVLECFIEEKILDEATPCIPDLGNELMRGFRLRKKGFGPSVYIWMNSKTIIITESTFPSRLEIEESEVVRDINIEEFDGLDFSKKLLDYIQRKVYSRKESYEQSIFRQDI